MHLRRLLLLSLASGLLSYLGFRVGLASLPEPLSLIFYFSPGLCFGALVLAPVASEGNGVPTRRLGLVISSALIWYIALQVAVEAWPNNLVGIVSGTSAGVLGALLICMASQSIIPQKLSPRQIMLASLAGVVGGAAIGTVAEDWVPNWLGHLGYFSGFIVWQMGVAFALFSGYFLRSESSEKLVQPTR